MLSLGSKKKEASPRVERCAEQLPQLSNEMQLSIMNKVKSGELSIEDALDQARKGGTQVLQQQSQAEEEQEPTQHNFSVHKHNRYRWQKRVLQIDFKTKMLCSIQKGIVQRQLSFSRVKSCDDGAGSRFSISFKDHHDYELEATSLEDKHKITQLVSQIIYGNIYGVPEGGSTDPDKEPQASLREGVLLLHRGGLASFRWVKYEVCLHPGQLTMTPSRQQIPADEEGASYAPMATVVHLSDGDTRVEKLHSPDTFTLITHKNTYQFRLPAKKKLKSQRGRSRSWSQLVDLVVTFAPQVTVTLQTTRLHQILSPLVPQKAIRQTLNPSLDPGGRCLLQMLGPKTRSPPPNPLPPPPRPHPPTKRPHLLPQSTSLSALNPDQQLPTFHYPHPPPPLPRKCSISKKRHTKPFHWDVVAPDKIEKSFWMQRRSRRIEINTARLIEQFSVKDLGTLGVPEPSNGQQIMLNQKIAHNFNIFLKSFPVQPRELKDKLFIISEEDGGLSDEHITSLRRYVPTVDDVEKYKSHKGPVSELHIVDQYMMEMCNIPFLSTQLDLLLTLRELPVGMSDLQPLINQKIRMCTQLKSCRSFVSVLEHLLAIGNYLNENARKEKAKGIRLSSLTKLSQLRGRDRGFTLLHAVVEQIILHEPSLAAFTQELAEFETIPGASIKGLTAEIDVLKNELQKVIQYRKTSKRKTGSQQAKFSKDLKTLIDKYNTDLSALTKLCEEMKKLYSTILVKFGEAADQDSQELFGLISHFVHDFRRTHADLRSGVTAVDQSS
ncbi:formin-like protein 13 [Takifugu rubripes]|uniref:formin-like protein 13 n=1 Tax=Takifugu rubripes TaxID=31033 RepID=UPI001145864C|nr:formin-like protein 13 [Takifugu rubripes]